MGLRGIAVESGVGIRCASFPRASPGASSFGAGPPQELASKSAQESLRQVRITPRFRIKPKPTSPTPIKAKEAGSGIAVLA